MKRKYLLLLPATLLLWVGSLLIALQTSTGLWQYQANCHKSNYRHFRNNTLLWVIGKQGEYLYLINPVYPETLRLTGKTMRNGLKHYQFELKQFSVDSYLRCDESLELTSLGTRLQGNGRIHNCQITAEYGKKTNIYSECTVKADKLAGVNILE